MKTVNPHFPKGLMKATRYFSDQRICLELVAKSRWPNGPACPRCASNRLSFLKTRLTWKCLDCKKQFSVKVGTILEDSAIPLDKWLTAMWLFSNCTDGISSHELADALGIMKRTARFMLHRVRYAMRTGSINNTGSINKMTGTVETAETFVDGGARNMHAGKRREKIRGTPADGPSGGVWIA
jgi:transposase-like protein